MNKRPLDGIKVLDWTCYQVGAVAAQQLGDMGADVIKIEQPGTGDPMRGLREYQGVPLERNGRNILYENWNRSKRGITLDLSKAKGKEIVYRLVKKADVFLQNFRLPAAAALGVDYKTLRKYNPRLIYGHATSYGEKGPDSDKPGVDLSTQARSGVMLESGCEGMPPVPITSGIADEAGGIVLAYGIVTALYAREKLGIGQEVNTSILQSLIGLQFSDVTQSLITKKSYARQNRDAAHNVLWNYYKCKDGRWLLLAGVTSDKFWPRFCECVGRPDLVSNPKYAGWMERKANARELTAVVDGIMATRTSKEWLEVLAPVDMPINIINGITDLETDPQVIENDYIWKFDHPVIGQISVVGHPFTLSKTPAYVSRAAPEFGEHTEEILLELGYTWDDISALRDEKLI